MTQFTKIAQGGKADQEISDAELDSLTNAIKTRYGIDFTNYEKASLKRGFVRLIQKQELENIMGLWVKIMKDKEFLIHYIDDLTVNLTELFRNPEVWMKIRDEILPKIRVNSELCFWHAGCSSGEEVYTMAIVLQDQGLLYKSRALATDLSSSILEQAKAGEYSQILMNKYEKTFKKYFPNGKLEDWFDASGEIFKIKSKYKNHIQFLRHNLVQDKMNEKFDIIFCRNVMIYFDDVIKMRALRLFHACLKKGGYLIIGYYDMLPIEYRSLFELYDSTTRIYKKIDD